MRQVTPANGNAPVKRALENKREFHFGKQTDTKETYVSQRCSQTLKNLHGNQEEKMGYKKEIQS